MADTYASLGFKVYVPEFLDPVYKGPIENVPEILKAVQQQKMPALKERY